MRVLVFILVSLLLLCSSKKEKNKPEPLMRFNDYVVTKNDFLARCEFTIRPGYCSMDSKVDKQIALNSIIAEAVFDREAGDDSPLMKKEKFQSFLKGVKNQAIRDGLFKEEVWDSIQIDSTELFKKYEKSNKTFNVDYVFTRQREEIMKCRNKIDKGMNFEAMAKDFYGGKKPEEKQIAYGLYEKTLETAIFKDTVWKNEIIGPVETSHGYYLLKINGWVDEVMMTPNQIKNKLDDLSQDIKLDKAEMKWEEYVKKVMKGKVINFKEEIFYDVAKAVMPLYLGDSNDSVSLPTRSEYVSGDMSKIDEFLKKNEGKPFFEFDGETWSVGRFVKAMWERPLIFPRKNIKKENFPAYFQKAIAELVRDHCLNQVGVSKGLGDSPFVQKQVKTWKRYYNARYYIDNYLMEKGIPPESLYVKNTIYDHLNPLFDSLKIKYSEEVYVDRELLDKVRLTRVPMVARKKNAVYPQLVPPFPFTTTSNKLNYKKMDEK